MAAVGMEYPIKALAKSLLPSSRAPSRPGPITIRGDFLVQKVRDTSTRGFSGPTDHINGEVGSMECDGFKIEKSAIYICSNGGGTGVAGHAVKMIYERTAGYFPG